MSATETTSEPELHVFQPASPSDLRSCCPALNALAAHGYLPRSGSNITFSHLLQAVQTVYNTSLPLALLLTSAGFLACGHNGIPTLPFLGKIDLNDISRHGRIEHDASLAHVDAEPGAIFAPTKPDGKLLEELLREAHGSDSLGLEDIARVRAKREVALTLSGRPLDSVHAEITRGEVALILSIIGDGEKVSTQSLKQWMGEDRLPDGWQRPAKMRGLLETVKMARKVEAAVDGAKASLRQAAGSDVNTRIKDE